MLTHEDIWRAIDNLAASRSMSVSGLARRAGLDATAFNRSKRVSANGKKRWPSTESVAKVLTAGNASFGEFVGLIDGGDRENRGPDATIPVLSLAGSQSGEFFESNGLPTGSGWGKIAFPNSGGTPIYALDITGDELEPAFRDGDTIIVSAGDNARRGDRVVARLVDGSLLVAAMGRTTATTVELHVFGQMAGARICDLKDVQWISRIIWAAQ